MSWPGSLTFAKDVAPIVYANCARCHRPGESGPFSLLTYADVRKHAKQIAQVTNRRYMPPWPPEHGYGEFSGARHLTAAQIAILQQWVADGAPEGDRAQMPPPPKFVEGWQLGKPDLVVTMPQPYTLPAAGSDVFRNFVIPVPISGTRYVRAVEFRAGNPRIVHHAMILLDRTPASRELDARDPEPGYAGMLKGEARFADGQFLVWVPNASPYGGTEDQSFRLDAGTDLVLQMHLRPSGKAETIRSSVGIFFASKPPTRTAMILSIGSQTIDIPAGKKDYAISDAYTLPVDAEVLALLPHAHYLGKEMRGFAKLPDGSKRWLIFIKDWDFNWQGAYRYVSPVFLPRGTTLVMQFTYDNSSENPRNPHVPPQRVVYGPESTNEMGQIELQVLPRSAADLAALQSDYAAKDLAARIAGLEKAVELAPGDPEQQRLLAMRYLDANRFDEAMKRFRESIRLKPDFVEARHSLGTLLVARGKRAEAEAEFQEALRIRPDFSIAQYSLGDLYFNLGRLDEAAEHYANAARIKPNLAVAYYGLGNVLAKQGKPALAAEQYAKALRITPDFAMAYYALGQALSSQGSLSRARQQYEAAIRVNPDLGIAHCALGNVFAAQGELERAEAEYETAVRLNPDLGEAYQNLAKIRETRRHRP